MSVEDSNFVPLQELERIDLSERSLLFHLEKLLGQDLFELANTRASIRKALSDITIPSAVEELILRHIDCEQLDEAGLDKLAEYIYYNVLVFKVLDLEKPNNWNFLADDKAEEMTDQELIKVFWKNVKAKNINISDAVNCLVFAGFGEPDELKKLFSL